MLETLTKVKKEMNDAARKRIIQQYYSKRSKDYDRQKSRTWKTSQGFSSGIINEILSVLTAFDNKPVLEVGVGSGRNALPLMRESKPQFVGLDLSKEMLTLANTKMSAFKRRSGLILGDAEYLPFCNDAFDAVVCMSTMHYSTSQDKMLKRFSTILKRKGTFVYGDLTIHESDDQEFLEILERTLSEAHSRYYKPTEMQKLMEACGFGISKIKSIAYRKSYRSLIEDKGQYFHINPERLHRLVRDAPAAARTQYELTNTEMTLYYTIITAQKVN
jgi:ubiquinone/menaquinone biosynthesis C-methylase UbiE